MLNQTMFLKIWDIAGRMHVINLLYVEYMEITRNDEGVRYTRIKMRAQDTHSTTQTKDHAYHLLVAGNLIDSLQEAGLILVPEVKEFHSEKTGTEVSDPES